MKAIALISGGLDSILAARVVKEQGVEVIPLNFKIPFCHRQAKLPLDQGVNTVDISQSFIKLLENPRYGFGANMNPCIDCKILMLETARGLMRQMDASFVVTGEVLGQRPMSQHRQALELIEKRSGLEGLLLRPLSAKLLAWTIPEKEGWVKREKLFDFGGRTRRPQMELARQFNIRDYPNPAGGCLLTDLQFSRRLKDLIAHRELNMNNIELLKIGRHFRLSDQAKLVVGRNEKEDKELLDLAKDGDCLFMPPLEIAGATCLGRGIFNQGLLELACSITCRYCDSGAGQSLPIIYKKTPVQGEETIEAPPIEEDKLAGLRL